MVKCRKCGASKDYIEETELFLYTTSSDKKGYRCTVCGSRWKRGEPK